MGFNPLEETGTPIDQQVHNWDELNVEPYDPGSVHPYTRTRVILMNGIEVEAAIFGHQFARHTPDMKLRRQLAQVRRVEQQQQKMVNWLLPADESALEITIGYEQVAVDLTAWLARTEPTPHVKDALDFALIEDFDHLYRYANLMEMTQGKQAQEITGDLTEIMPGRATAAEHRHPFDSPVEPASHDGGNFLSKLHIMTIIAAEQQTMNFYMNVGNRPEQMLGRGLYAEIAQIEEQHVTHYESLADPTASWFEQLLLHEYNECYLYYSCMQHEVDNRIKRMWRRHLEDEITHLHMACDLIKERENRDPQEILPDEMPELVKFQSNKDYVRDIINTQWRLTKDEGHYKAVPDLPENHRYFQYQSAVNDGCEPPSKDVIVRNIDKKGEDFRRETEGPHPVEHMRSHEHVS